MKKIINIMFLLCIISCKQSIDVKGKIFNRSTSEGNMYIYFYTENQFIEAFNSNGYLETNYGKYIRTNSSITIYDLKIYDKELGALFGYYEIGSLEVYYSERCIFFHYDNPDINFCEIGVNDLPATIKSAFSLIDL